MISVANLGKAFADRYLFSGVSMQFDPGKRYGIVGANGSGKSTFLKILSGEIPPTDGTVSLPRRARLGVLRQDHFLYEDHPILDVVMMGNEQLWSAIEAKEKMLQAPEEEFDAHRFSELEDTIQAMDGYALEAQAGIILEGLGIPSEDHRSLLSTLSGGFKLRVLLAQALASRPDVLLLDEPTNHLDILSIRWMETFLEEFKGCVLVVTHDHRFLDNVCTHIVDLDYETMTQYTGNYTAFNRAKREDRERKEAEIARQEKEIAHQQAFVERFRAKASKARQAQSKIKLLDRMEVVRLPRSSRRYPTFRLKSCRPSGKQVLLVEGISKAYGDNQVLENVSIEIRRGERVAIIGPNGIGKSTLLKILVGVTAADSGEHEWGYETYPGYFPQDHLEVLEGSGRDVEGWLWDFCAGEPMGFVRNQLGMVLFSGDDVKKKISALSGGEAARLLFARLAVQYPNVLVLDEPTNHLDLEAIEALVDGLQAYDGTLLFVSHDRWFVSRLADRIIEITADGINDFPGGYEEFVASCGDDHLDVENVVLKVKRDKRKKERPGAGRAMSRETSRQLKELKAARDRTTAAIEEAEARLAEINEAFCRPGFFEETPGEEVGRLREEQADLEARIETLMQDWEDLEKEIEAVT